ncbi:MAG TPA: hypothetical protein PKI01_10795 [Bacteroidales bacterium]|nr:hypothetical protein [Bacteroidales bacterium]
MKRILIVPVVVIGVLMFLQSFKMMDGRQNTEIATIDSTYLITDGRVGRLEINMDAAKLKNIFSEQRLQVKKSSSGDDEYAIYNILEPDGKTLAFEVESLCADICLVSRINIVSPKYKTIAGIGVGSTFAEIKKNYSMRSIVGGEDDFFMIYVKDFGDIAFLIKSTDKKPKFGKPYEAAEIPDSDVISRILIF